ncbi:unnamed protein product, partial [Rotaria magnacalcarata]
MDDITDSLFFVNTSTIDVVIILDAKGLYSPDVVTLVGVGVVDEVASKVDDDAANEIESDNDVDEIFDTVDDVT